MIKNKLHTTSSSLFICKRKFLILLSSNFVFLAVSLTFSFLISFFTFTFATSSSSIFSFLIGLFATSSSPDSALIETLASPSPPSSLSPSFSSSSSSSSLSSLSSSLASSSFSCLIDWSFFLLIFRFVPVDASCSASYINQSITFKRNDKLLK